MKRIVSWLLVVFLFGSASLTALAEEERPFDGETVKLGLVSGPDEDVWKTVQEAAEKEGITLEIVLFNDYVQPNVALDSGSVDLNAFQHQAYLEDWNEANDADLAILDYTYVSSLGAYSEKVDSLDDLEEGATITIPNDPTNGGRALLALEIAGLIKLADLDNALPEVSDIVENDLNLTIEELDATQLVNSLKDVDAAFINTNFVVDAGLSLQEDAIFIDSDYPTELNELYKNLIAVREEDKDNPLFERIKELYQTEEVAQAIYDLSDGGDRAIWDNAPEVK